MHETPPVDASKTGLSASKSRTLLDFLCNEEEKDLHFGKYQLQDLKVWQIIFLWKVLASPGIFEWNKFID